MSDPIYTFHRGEPIQLAREVVSGDPAGYTVTARLKATKGRVVPAASAPAVADFDVTFVAAAGGEPARWLLTIPAATAAGLAPGSYVTDVRFALAGVAVAVSEPAFITILGSVSG